jgi:hypothetical protein
MVWKKDTFERGPKLPFPKEAMVFGIAMGDVRGTGKADFVVLDTMDHISVFAEDGKAIYRGRDRYGGTNNFYDTQKKKSEIDRGGTTYGYRVFIPGRVVVKRNEAEGIAEVIVNKNDFSASIFERVKMIDKAEVYSLVWKDNRFETNWKTKEIRGYIADYQLKDAANTGAEELVVAVVLPTEGGAAGAFSRKTESILQFFKLD